MNGYETLAPELSLFPAEMRVPRDAALKQFALNADFIRHLLRAQHLKDLDEAQIASIRPASANLIAPDLSQRLTDAAWQLELKGSRLAYLLIECQAEPDPTMLFRAFHSVAALALKLSRNPPPEHSSTSVPRVHHLTLYTGRQAWTIADADAESGKEKDPYWDCVYRFFQLMDLRRLPDPGGNENLAVLLARLQRCEDPEALRETAVPMQTWAEDPAHAELASAFAAWITRVILPDIGITDAPVSDNFREVLEMLEREHLTWGDRIRAEGLRSMIGMLLRIAKARFGADLAERLESRLEGITDTDRLADIGEWIVVCESGEALLARVQAS